MKNIFKLIGIITLAAAIGFSMTACDLGLGDDSKDPQLWDDGNGIDTPAKYSSVGSDGYTYTLVISRLPALSVTRAAITPQAGDKYVLTIENDDTLIATSTGTVTTFWYGMIVLKHNTGASFIVSVNSNGITSMIKADGSALDYIPVDEGSSIGAPGVITPVIPSGAPAVPGNIRVTATTSSTITIMWDAVSGATGYYVYKLQSGGYIKLGTSYTLGANITGLSANTTYYFMVSAYNSSGEGSLSSVVTGATNSGTDPGTDPGNLPSELAATKYVQYYMAGTIRYDFTMRNSIGDVQYATGTIAMKPGKILQSFTAEGTTGKWISKDGKYYMVVEESYQVFVMPAGSFEDFNMSIPEGGTYTTGFGSIPLINEGPFPYIEFEEEDGVSKIYLKDGEVYAIVNTFEEEGQIGTNVMVITYVTNNVPDSLFNWPSNYTVTDYSGGGIYETLGYTKGWPTADILTNYNISGMPQPAGASNIYYMETEEGGRIGLNIVFQPSEGTQSAVQSWITGNGWTNLSTADVGASYYKGTIPNYTAILTYTYNSPGNSYHFIVVINGD